MVIYTPQGKAKEYCDLAVNLYNGCEHSCSYCYVPIFTKREKKDFHSTISVRKNILESLLKEAQFYKDKEVLLCFTCDPYQPIAIETGITRKAIEILQSQKIIVNILTKAGMKSTVDFDLLSTQKSKYGATLTFIDKDQSLKYEQKAALPEERFKALEIAHNMGIETWVSLEPVIDIEQTFEIVKITADFVDTFKVGKWNYDKKAKEINWKDFRKKIVDLFKKKKVNFYIKKDLR